LPDQTDDAFVAALRALNADTARLERDLDVALDGFRTGNTRNLVLSTWIPKWFERAWLAASAERGEAAISSLDLLLALLGDDGQRGAVSENAPVLLRLEAARLLEAYSAIRQHGNEGSTGGNASHPWACCAKTGAKERNFD
jgi:type VI secretion system protein VasG